MNRSRHLVVLAVAGLMLLMSFASGATAAVLITGKQIKDNTVASRDIKNRTLTSRDVKDRTLKVRDFKPKTRVKLTGPQGPQGDQGIQGLPGEQGLPGLPGIDGIDGVDGLPGADGLPGIDGIDGVSGYEIVTNTQTIAATLTDTVQASCPAGKTAIAASGGFDNVLALLASQVARVDGDTFSVTGLNSNLAGEQLSIDVVCALVTP